MDNLFFRGFILISFGLTANCAQLAPADEPPIADKAMSKIIPGNTLAFASSRADGVELFIQHTTDTLQLTDKSGNDMDPSTDAAGKYLSFTSVCEGNPEIFLADLTSGKITRRTQQPDFDGYARLSGDGEHLAYITRSPGTGMRLAVQSFATGTEKIVSTDDGDAFAPVWSPDSSKIAFAQTLPENIRKQNLKIYDLKSDTIETVTSDAGKDFRPRWSPDGQTLVFASQREKRIKLYAVDITTKQETKLTETDFAHTFPVISRDGKDIYFVAKNETHPNGIIQATTLTGAAPKDVAIPAGDILQMSLTPDGTKLYYVASVGVNQAAYLLDPATKNQQELIAPEPVLMNVAMIPSDTISTTLKTMKSCS